MENMTPQDIVKNSDTLKGSGQDWKHVYANLHLSVKTPEYRIFRAGNTLFWVHIDSPGVGQVYTFNADPQAQLFDNVQEFLQAMKVAKYTELYALAPDPMLFTRLQQAGYDVSIEQLSAGAFKGTIHV